MSPPVGQTTWTRRQLVGSTFAAAAGAWFLPRSPRSEALDTLVAELVTKHRMPGAVVAFYRDGQISKAAAGLANLNTGTLMTADTAFLTGSVTKVWTASLLMTFVDEGRLDLDRPVISYLPRFRLADMAAARSITPRQLLNHTSGIDAGDYLLDLGEGREAHRRYVEAMADLGQIHAPGAYSSYCNGGFILAGHLVEEISGQSWGDLIRDRLIAPLGLPRTITEPDDAVLNRTAVGSVPDSTGAGGHRATAKFLLPKSAAPAGATLITTVGDSLEFAAMHMRGGVSRDGRRVLSAASVKAMATRTTGRPAGSGGYGLGWGVTGQPGAVRLSHSGGSNGGIAQLVAMPDRGIAYVAFANSSMSYGFHGELQRRVMADLMPSPPPTAPPARPTPNLDIRRVVGSYRRKTQVTVIREDGGRIMAEVRMIPEEARWSEAYNAGQPTLFEVVATGDTELTSKEPVLLGQPATFQFLEPGSDGRFGLVYSAGRLSRRGE